MNNGNKHKLSVITPLYHGEKYISILVAQIEACAQYISDIGLELVLSNDAPNEYIKDTFPSALISVKVINTDKNRGIHGARVRGLLHSSGDYILFLDQDDMIVPKYFSSQLKAIGSADAVVCNALSGGMVKYNTDRPLYKTADRKSMINDGNMILSPGQVLLRREAIPKSWTQNIMCNNGADDWFLWLCMHSEGKRFVINQQPLFIREVHYQNASFDSLRMAASEQETVALIEREHLLKTEERNALRKLLPQLQEKRIKENEKFKKMFLIQNDWFGASRRGLSIADYLINRQIRKVAVYGYGYLGRSLLEDLEKSNIEIAYVIDKNAKFLEIIEKCCTLEDTLEQVDAVIVTMVSSARNIVENVLKEKIDAEIIWLEEMVLDMVKVEKKGCTYAKSVNHYSGL